MPRGVFEITRAIMTIFNKMFVLHLCIFVMGLHSNQIIPTNFLVKYIILLWNMVCLIFGFCWWLLTFFRLKCGISNRYSNLEGGFFVNACFEVATILTISIILLFRLWVIWCDIYKGGKNNSIFKRVFKNYTEFWQKHKEFRPNRLKISVNEIIYFLIIFSSLVRHCIMIYAQNKIFILINYKPEPQVMSVRLEHAMRYFQAIVLDVSPLDCLGLFCIFLVKAMERCISQLNDRIEQSMKMRRQPCNHANNFKQLLYSKYNKSTYFISPREISTLHNNLVLSWMSMKDIVGPLLVFCFGMWMVNLCFNCFFSYTSTVDLGATQPFAITFHYMIVSTVIKFLCTGSAVFSMEYQVCN